MQTEQYKRARLPAKKESFIKTFVLFCALRLAFRLTQSPTAAATSATAGDLSKVKYYPLD
jgi:hypothetical protein